MRYLFGLSLAGMFFGLMAFAEPQKPAPAPPKERRIEGVVRAFRGRALVLDGDRVVSVNGDTQYLLETGRDAKVVGRSAVEEGKFVVIGAKEVNGDLIALRVFVRRFVPIK